MSKIKVELGQGGVLYKVPVLSLKEVLTRSSFTKAQQSKMLELLTQQTKDLKSHFKDGAWRIDLDFVVNDVLMDVLGIDLFYVKAALSNAIGTDMLAANNTTYLINTKDKVFLDTSSNKLYVDIKAKNASYDIQLGDL